MFSLQLKFVHYVHILRKQTQNFLLRFVWKYSKVCAFVYRYSQACAFVHRYSQACAFVYRYHQACAFVYRYNQACAFVYRYSQVCAFVYRYSQVCALLEGMWVKGCTALLILTLSSRERWVVSFMPWTIWSWERYLLLARNGSTNSCVVQFVAEYLCRAREPDCRLLSKTDHLLHKHVQKFKFCWKFYCEFPVLKPLKCQVKLLFLSSASQFPKENWVLEGSQASPVFASAKSIMCRWKKVICPSAIMFTTKLTLSD